MQQNPSQKHHYIPRFYLKRWCKTVDEKLCHFTKPVDTVVPRRVSPSQTGFQSRLYTIRELPDDLAGVVEDEFFKPIDSRAAEALSEMERSRRAVDQGPLRSAWCNFLHSLLLRTPKDLEDFRGLWTELITNDADGRWERRYSAARREGDPATLKDYRDSLAPHILPTEAMRTLTNLITDPSMAEKMSSLAWSVLDTYSARHELLTSDQPVVRTAGLKRQGGHLILPIGPRLLFVAAPEKETIRRIRGLNPNRLTETMNRSVCEQAVRFVYGRTDSQLAFVTRHFSKRPQSGPIQNIAFRQAKLLADMIALDRTLVEGEEL